QGSRWAGAGADPRGEAPQRRALPGRLGLKAMEGDIVIRGSARVSTLRFAALEEAAARLDPARSVIVTDAEIARLHGGRFPPFPLALVERGEAAKSLSSLEALYARFLELGLGRDSTVLAIGGGSVSDLAGFAASTWLRGVDFRFVPSTLLAMVDASVGGKNGIDFRGLKNLIGSFGQPGLVVFDTSLLDTLGQGGFASGMAEAIKHALIEGEEHLAVLESLGTEASAIGRADRERLVRLSVTTKAAIVGSDEREAGGRRRLNLGHTIGHAVEAVTALPHGHSVAAGLASALLIAERRGLLGGGLRARVVRLLSAWGLPSSLAAAASLAGVADGPGYRQSLVRALAADKKRTGGQIQFAMPEAPGHVSILPIHLEEIGAFVLEAP
ncbi:MAG TPA: 3-dehydroquinate synthase family protein, partial [Rectinemataceae bacterium]|nr:3-dehydroquinate synthase family protein [Rectinemataceae bacterium]